MLTANCTFQILIPNHSSRIFQVDAAVRSGASSLDLVKLLSVPFSAISNDADRKPQFPNPSPETSKPHLPGGCSCEEWGIESGPGEASVCPVFRDQ